MTTPETALLLTPKRPPSPLSAIALGGVLAGSIDMAADAWIYGQSPSMILQTTAGELLGQATYTGGMKTVVLGLILQWATSIAIVAIYVFLARRRPVLAKRWLPGGLAYGAIIFLVINYVVLPLSAWRTFSRFTPATAIESLAAMLLFGLIASFTARNVSPIRAPVSD